MGIVTAGLGRVAVFLLNCMPDWQHEELVAMEEHARLVARDPKYENITFALHLASTLMPFTRFLPGRPIGIAPGLFTAYFFCRVIDDIADGDRPLVGFDSFEDLADNLKRQMEENAFGDSNVEILLRGTIRDMQKYRGVDIRPYVVRFLDAMNYECQRRISHQVSTRQELYNLYQNSFGVPQDMAFIGIGSHLRSSDIPELADLQGRIYAVRDLEQELQQGIVFIPNEVGSIDATSLAVQDWVREELRQGHDTAEHLRSLSMDWKARRIVGFIADGIDEIISAYK